MPPSGELHRLRNSRHRFKSRRSYEVPFTTRGGETTHHYGTMTPIQQQGVVGQLQSWCLVTPDDQLLPFNPKLTTRVRFSRLPTPSLSERATATGGHLRSGSSAGNCDKSRHPTFRFFNPPFLFALGTGATVSHFSVVPQQSA